MWTIFKIKLTFDLIKWKRNLKITPISINTAKSKGYSNFKVVFR